MLLIECSCLLHRLDLKSGIDLEACWERVSGEDGRRTVSADE